MDKAMEELEGAYGTLDDVGTQAAYYSEVTGGFQSVERDLDAAAAVGEVAAAVGKSLTTLGDMSGSYVPLTGDGFEEFAARMEEHAGPGGPAAALAREDLASSAEETAAFLSQRKAELAEQAQALDAARAALDAAARKLSAGIGWLGELVAEVEEVRSQL